MRLIDADELKRELSHAIWLPEWEHIRDKVLKDIDLQPTAYDSDKVVNQLKELKAQDYDDSDEAPEWEDIENVYEDGRSQGRYEAYYNAIELVKRGGIDET